MSNGYTYSAPFTADELHRDYVTLGMTQAEVGAKWGVSPKVVWRALQKCSIPSRRAAARNQKGSANNNWKGGRNLQAKAAAGRYGDAGYIYVKRPEHPNAQNSGYVAEHILVALDAAGHTALPPGHCVHHINLRKHDNDPRNLAICSHKDHQTYHTQLEELAVKLLLETGRITFKEGVGYVAV